jgi:hypothetical protein
MSSGNRTRVLRSPATGPDVGPVGPAGVEINAVGTVAACGFSGVLYKVVTSPTVLTLIKDVIEKAFHLGF